LNARLKDQVKEAEAAKAHMKIQLEEADRVNAQLKDQVIEAQQANVQLNVQLEEADRVNAQLKDQLRAAEEDSKQAREEKHLDLWLRGQMIVQLNEQMRLLSEVACYRDRLSESEHMLSKLDEELRKVSGEKEALERKEKLLELQMTEQVTAHLNEQTRLLAEERGYRDRLAVCNETRTKLEEELRKVSEEKEALERSLVETLKAKKKMESELMTSEEERSIVVADRENLLRRLADTVAQLRKAVSARDFTDASCKPYTWSKDDTFFHTVLFLVQRKEHELKEVRTMLQNRQESL